VLRRLVPTAFVIALLLVPAATSRPAVERGVIASVTDGDTLRLVDGRRVRLLQIDTPELGSGECYSRAARTELLRLAPPGPHVVLEADPQLDRVDGYGRASRYIGRGGGNVNVELVRRGAATPYFYRGERGRYAGALVTAAALARAAKRGLWKACPATVLDPYRPVQTGRSGPRATPSATSSCAPSYPGVCIPPPPPDLDCADVPARSFAVRWDVADPDPHHFDGDRDGVGCER
jgi:endonuclease YncB( thermonuclease family)